MNTQKGYMWSLLRLLLIFGAYKGVEASTGWRRRETNPWDFLSLKMELFVNPMYEGLRNMMKVMWPEATLAPLLDRITYFATLGSKNSINEIDFPWIDGQVKWLAHISAFQISELGKWVLFGSLLVYAGSLLLRMLHQCCNHGDILDINYVSCAKELAESPTEDVPELIKKIKQKERDMTGVKHPSHHRLVFSSLANFPDSASLFFPRFGVSFCMSPSRGASPPSGADENMELLELHNM